MKSFFLIQAVAVALLGGITAPASCQSQIVKKLAGFDAHNEYVHSIVFSQDAEKMVSVGLDRLIKVWDCKTHKLLRTIDLGDTQGPGFAAFGPDNKTLFYSARDRFEPRWRVYSCEFNDAKRKGLVSWEGQRFHEIWGDRKLAVLQGSREKDGKTAHVVDFIDLDGKKPTQAFTWKWPLDILGFSQDKKFVLLKSGQDTVTVADIATSKAVAELSGREVFLCLRKLRLSPDNKSLLGALIDDEGKRWVVVWDLGTRKITSRVPTYWVFYQIAEPSHDGRMMPFIEKTRVLFFDFKKNQLSHRRCVIGAETNVNCLSFAPGGRFFAMGTTNGQIRIFERPRVDDDE